MIYARVSSEKQAEEGATSIEEQVRACREFAERHGWTVTEVYREEGFTGTALNRPQLDRLMAAAEAGEFGRVVCLNGSRWARDPTVSALLKQDLAELDVTLSYVSGDIDRSTDEGGMFDGILDQFHAYERKKLLRQMANGAHGKARDGRWPSADRSAPFGYRVHKEGTTPAELRRSARLVPDERERETVLTAVRLILDEGRTSGQAAEYLNAQGLTPRGKLVRQPDGEVVTVPAEWTGNTLRQMLERESLTGHVEWGAGRFARVKREGVPWRDRPLKYKDPVVIPGVEPVLDRARWVQVGQVLRERWAQREPQSFVYWLSGVTSECGRTYSGLYRARLNKRSYRCAGKKPPAGTPACGCAWLDADQLEETAWTALCDHLGDPAELERAARQHLALVEGSATSQADELASLSAAIEQRETARSARVKAAMRAGIDLADVAEFDQEERRAIVAMEARRADIARFQADTKQQAAALDDVAALAKHMAGNLPGLDARGRAMVVAALDLRRWVDRDEEGRLVLHLHSERGAAALAAVLPDGDAPRSSSSWVSAPLSLEVGAALPAPDMSEPPARSLEPGARRRSGGTSRARRACA